MQKKTSTKLKHAQSLADRARASSAASQGSGPKTDGYVVVIMEVVSLS